MSREALSVMNAWLIILSNKLKAFYSLPSLLGQVFNKTLVKLTLRHSCVVGYQCSNTYYWQLANKSQYIALLITHITQSITDDIEVTYYCLFMTPLFIFILEATAQARLSITIMVGMVEI